VKWCAGIGGLLSHSLEDAGPERDDSTDEDERNGRCEQATSPDTDPSHLRLNQASGGILQYLLRCLWFKISLHLKALLTPKDGSSPPLFVRADEWRKSV